MTATATQAIGYIRRSTDRQEESLDQQRAKLEAFAQAKGWTLAHVYVDDAISGSDMERPGLRDLMKRAESDKAVSAVIAWNRNRLARPKDAIDGLMLERRILMAGKRAVYAATNREADRSFAGALVGFVEHHLNGDYLRKLSRDTARGVLSRVQHGRWPNWTSKRPICASTSGPWAPRPHMRWASTTTPRRWPTKRNRPARRGHHTSEHR